MARRCRPGPAVGKTKKGWYEYLTKASADRWLLREVVDMDISSKTGDRGAEMRWEVLAFQTDIVLFYGIILYGWPPYIRFQNPSKMKITVIRHLLKLIELGRLYFRTATPGELFAAQESIYNAAPCLLFERPITRNCRRNLNQHWARPSIDPVRFPPRFVRNGPKSARGVDTDSSGDEGSSSGTAM